RPWQGVGQGVDANAAAAVMATALLARRGAHIVAARTVVASGMRVAMAQDAPVFSNPMASTERAMQYIAKAGLAGVKLLAFGETWLPGYPFWLSSTGGARFDDPQQKAAYGAYVGAAIRADGPEMQRLARAS